MTLAEIVGSLFVLVAATGTFGWACMSSLQVVGHGKLETRVSDCLNDSAEEVVASRSLPENFAVDGNQCDVQSVTRLADGVKWVKIVAQMDGKQQDLWIRTSFDPIR